MVPPGPWRRRSAAEADRRTEERMACRCRAGMGRRAFLARAAVATATLPLAGCDAAVPDWLADLLVPEEVAAELGLQAFREILRDTPPVRDPGLQRQVAAVGRRIVEASTSPYREWRFVVLDGPHRISCASEASTCLRCQMPLTRRTRSIPPGTFFGAGHAVTVATAMAAISFADKGRWRGRGGDREKLIDVRPFLGGKALGTTS
jgi:hypothetical protein